MIEAKQIIIIEEEPRQLNSRTRKISLKKTSEFTASVKSFKKSNKNSILNSQELTKNSTFNSQELTKNSTFKSQELNKDSTFKSQELNKDSTLKCPECGSTNVNKDFTTNEFLCECGCVVDENIIDLGPEWRNFSNSDKDKSRVGMPKSVDIHDGGLGTSFSLKDKNITYENRMMMERLHRWNNRSRINGNKQRHLATAFSRLRYFVSNLALPLHVQKSAANYYRKVLELNLVHGRSIDIMVASCLYLACKEAKISRTFAEIEEVSGVKANKIANNSKLIKSKLNIKYTPTAPTEYVPRFVSNLGLSKDVEVKSLEIISKINPKSVTAKPSVVAASSIYLACTMLSLKVSQGKVSDATNISATTIRKWYKVIDDCVSC